MIHTSRCKSCRLGTLSTRFSSRSQPARTCCTSLRLYILQSCRCPQCMSNRGIGSSRAGRLKAISIHCGPVCMWHHFHRRTGSLGWCSLKWQARSSTVASPDGRILIPSCTSPSACRLLGSWSSIGKGGLRIVLSLSSTPACRGSSCSSHSKN